MSERDASVTDEDIRQLRADAMTARNTALAQLCGMALRGDEHARERIAGIVARAADSAVMAEYARLSEAYRQAVAGIEQVLGTLASARAVRDKAYAEMFDFKQQLGDATPDDPLCCQRYGRIHQRELSVPGCRWFVSEASRALDSSQGMP